MTTGASLTTTFEDALNSFNAGRFDQATAQCKEVIEAEPSNGRALHLVGFLLLNGGNLNDGLNYLEKAAKQPSENPLLFMQLGIARAMSGYRELALPAFEQAIKLEPNLPDAHYNLALTLEGLGNDSDAIDSYQKVVDLDPGRPDALCGLGGIYAATGQYEKALSYFDIATEKNPEFVVAYVNKGKVLSDLGRHEEAIQPFARAAELSPKDVLHQINLGNELTNKGDIQRALNVLQKAVELDRNSLEALTSYSKVLELANQPEKSKEWAIRALKIDSKAAEPKLTVARCYMREGEHQSVVDQLDELLAGPISDDIFVKACNLKGLALDRLGRFEDAFEAVSKSNATKRRSAEFQKSDLGYFPKLIRDNSHWFAGQRAKRWASTYDRSREAPVFFVGFPRSGTTLVEQMLDSHPCFLTGGENVWLDMILANNRLLAPDALDSLTVEGVNALRNEYWSYAERYHGDKLQGLRLVDKSPMNIVHLGLIRRIFPDSKVLVAIRDPRDCVLSCVMQDFAPNETTSHFLSINEAAQLYDQVMGLWAIYRENLGMACHQYRYEDLVENPEQTLRDIVAFLGEDWDERVLDYQGRSEERRVFTPSALDVSKPLFKRAINRWANYQADLAPVLPRLTQIAQQLGYDQ